MCSMRVWWGPDGHQTGSCKVQDVRTGFESGVDDGTRNIHYSLRLRLQSSSFPAAPQAKSEILCAVVAYTPLTNARSSVVVPV